MLKMGPLFALVGEKGRVQGESAFRFQRRTHGPRDGSKGEGLSGACTRKNTSASLKMIPGDQRNDIPFGCEREITTSHMLSCWLVFRTIQDKQPIWGTMFEKPKGPYPSLPRNQLVGPWSRYPKSPLVCLCPLGFHIYPSGCLF